MQRVSLVSGSRSKLLMKEIRKETVRMEGVEEFGGKVTEIWTFGTQKMDCEIRIDPVIIQADYFTNALVLYVLANTPAGRFVQRLERYACEDEAENPSN